jgi:hypothetical protein
MRQALHIFKKDARYLRWELGAMLLLMGTFVYTQTHHDEVRRADRGMIVMLLQSCFWAFLCARLIQAETIPGDRQFWLTRPYDWRSLLGAKLLFVVTFISAPLLVADAVILAWEGFSVAANLPGLLWSVMLTTVGLLMTLCAFATLTRGLAQWMVSLIVTVVAVIGLAEIGKGNVWGGVERMRDHGDIAILFIAASGVLIWQYRYRRTAVSIALMAAGLLASWLYGDYGSSALALEVQMRLSKAKASPSAIQVAFQPSAEHAAPRQEQYGQIGGKDAITLSLPIEVTGLGPGQDVMTDETELIVQMEDGQTLDLDQSVMSTLQHWPSGYRQILNVDREVYEKAKDRPVRLKLTMYLTLLGNPASKTIRLDAGAVPIPGVGLCRADGENAIDRISCTSPMHDFLNIPVLKLGPDRQDRFIAPRNYSPLPADSSISPLHRYFYNGLNMNYRGEQSYGGLRQVTLISLEPLAHFRRDLTLEGVHLADYQGVGRDFY